ncbi:hypothetical protein AXA65_12390 [Chryseobacterium sp. FP211-J200]|nr:hypothetical protein AXA65_12390 [Chryseobacterium sp. FP211-J200]
MFFLENGEAYIFIKLVASIENAKRRFRPKEGSVFFAAQLFNRENSKCYFFEIFRSNKVSRIS